MIKGRGLCVYLEKGRRRGYPISREKLPPSSPADSHYYTEEQSARFESAARTFLCPDA